MDFPRSGLSLRPRGTLVCLAKTPEHNRLSHRSI